MKNTFLPFLNYEDGATNTKGGTELIIQKMNELGEKQTQAINGVKADVTKLNEKAEDIELRVTEAKGTSQKALDKATEIEQKNGYLRHGWQRPKFKIIRDPTGRKINQPQKRSSSFSR